MALRAAFSARVGAATGVLLRDPLNPALPALAQDTTLPILSVSVTIVLLKVAWTWAIPTRTSFRSFLRPTFFGAAAGAGAAAAGFFFTITPRRGPLRVRALVCVRWPRTGRPFRCRIPR